MLSDQFNSSRASFFIYIFQFYVFVSLNGPTRLGGLSDIREVTDWSPTGIRPITFSRGFLFLFQIIAQKELGGTFVEQFSSVCPCAGLVVCLSVCHSACLST